ncbi:hypothetical protein CRENBAI_003525 [Crenichthys baileyi]|uniref:Uncharacterized protein n=1 Tax=Crenichthys baileyi TaxID=28760 RepID=A0AAV9R497_9TELE
MTVKNHVRSSGWLVEPNWEEKPTGRPRSFKVEEEREYLDKKMTNKDNMDVDQKDSQSLPQDRSSFKDVASLGGRKEWRVEDVPEQEKAEKEQTEKKVKVMGNEGSEMKMLLTHRLPRKDNTSQLRPQKDLSANGQVLNNCPEQRSGEAVLTAPA